MIWPKDVRRKTCSPSMPNSSSACARPCRTRASPICPLRAALMPLAQRTNHLIAKYSAGQANLGFIDVYSKIVDAEGRPRRGLYLADALHLDPQGYDIWRSVIAHHLKPPDRPTSAFASREP